MSRVIEHFPEWMTGGGIFAGLTGMPWAEDLPDATVLDIEYFGNRSGLKNSSVLLEHMTTFEGDTVITDVELGRLRDIITAKFLDSWQRVYTAMVKTAYSALENYDMEEIKTPDVSVKHKVSNDFNQHTVNKKTSGKTESSAYGFGGNTAKPTTKVDDTYTLQNDNTQTGYSEDETTGTETLTRHGNIGVTTSQQMLQAELDLRRQHFFDIVYNDVDTILTRGSWT